jgi:glycerophosphoryl diester phosphodiesterase
VEEVEFDLWMTSDGVAAVCHDPDVTRTTDGEGRISDLSWADLEGLDAGIRTGDLWRGIKIPRLEEVLHLVGDRAVLNIHIKDPGPGDGLVHIVEGCLKSAGLSGSAYLAGGEPVLEGALRVCPELERACLAEQMNPEKQIEKAHEYDCSRVQFRREVTEETVRKARRDGFICNLFYADDAEEARLFLGMGIDVILTNTANILLDAGIVRSYGDNRA